jgi:hypothetical protein
MVLSNAPQRVTRVSSLVNATSGGGSKKGGLPYQIGRSWRTSIALGGSNSTQKCCSLKMLQSMPNKNPKCNRPLVGRWMGGRRC